MGPCFAKMGSSAVFWAISLRRDVRDGFVDESARDAFRFVFKFVVVKAARQETLTRQGDRHTAGVNGYPSPAPTLSDVSGSAASAGGVEYEVAPAP